MGFLKMLFYGNSAEGVRESMRISYKKISGNTFLTGVDEKRHMAGLKGALKTRYLSYGRNMPDELVAAELVPFFLISPQEDAIDALSEYIVFKEKPIDAKIEALKIILKTNILRNHDSSWFPVLASAYQGGNTLPWMHLIDETTKAYLMDYQE